MQIQEGSIHNHCNSRAQAKVLLPSLVILCASFTAATFAAPILWNQLGSAQEILNSAYGPNLSFYAGGSFPDATGNPEYLPGVYGNALTIGAGSYNIFEREHTVVWTNLNQYLNPDRGTISVWYKQNATPVGQAHGVYRIFDGAYGLGSGIGLTAETVPTPGINFGMGFGGNYSGVSYDVSAYNGTWLHLAGVWDRAGIAGSADKIRLYVNGNIAAASSVAGWGTVVGQQADICGGNDGEIADKFAMDNLQVFDTAMTNFSGGYIEITLLVKIKRVGAAIVISFKGGELETAPAVFGPWTGTGNSSGSYTNLASEGPTKFYRVHVH